MVAKKTSKKATKERPVIVTTEHRAVVFGYASDTSGSSIHLRGGKWAIYWGTTRGIAQLAATGPTTSSKISLPADLVLHKVTAVFEVTTEAEAAWNRA